MKKWQELSENTLAEMRSLGNFGPTSRESDRLIKGYMWDDDGGGKCYWSSDDLRKTAVACIEVADWLDERADAIPEHGII